MTKREALAWAAGLFEGEGSFHITPQSSVSMQMVSTDHDVIERFATVIGIHTGVQRSLYFYPRDPSTPWKSYWVWSVNGKDVKRVTQALQPWLGQRRSLKAQECLDTLRRTRNFTCERCAEELTNHQRRFCSDKCRYLTSYQRNRDHILAHKRKAYAAKHGIVERIEEDAEDSN